MRIFIVCMVLACGLVGAPTFAQTTAAPRPVAPAPTAQAAPAPKPLPAVAGVAYIELQRIFQGSASGRAFHAQWEKANQRAGFIGYALSSRRDDWKDSVKHGVTDKQLQAENVREREMEQEQTKMEQQAQALQAEFQKKLDSVIQQLASKRGLLMVFNADAGIVWADAASDLTPEVIRALDASNPPASTQSAPAPAATSQAGGSKPAGTKPPGGRE